ncbi:hypothetical protein GGX14DRAFT_670482 [Mycena pura]|uniref:Uncharacterized protein n=1 Tax=Mycena pura TaxID=153505 RepID=A0AAD6VV49_9AGAR|nr:hypothetical protein GGX14DRAFT_670482 [Mycena pura]
MMKTVLILAIACVAMGAPRPVLRDHTLIHILGRHEYGPPSDVQLVFGSGSTNPDHKGPSSEGLVDLANVGWTVDGDNNGWTVDGDNSFWTVRGGTVSGAEPTAASS